jgi:excisionase family DNA binding protein
MPKATMRDVHPRVPLKPRLYSVAQVATLLGISASSVYNLVAEKKLAAIKIGDRNLIRVETVEKFIDSQPAATAAPRRASRHRRLG